MTIERMMELDRAATAAEAEAVEKRKLVGRAERGATKSEEEAKTARGLATAAKNEIATELAKKK